MNIFFNKIVNYLQTINFFNLGTKLCLVDLPGYGFAYAKEEVKEAWDDLVSMQIIFMDWNWSCLVIIIASAD